MLLQLESKPIPTMTLTTAMHESIRNILIRIVRFIIVFFLITIIVLVGAKLVKSFSNRYAPPVRGAFFLLLQSEFNDIEVDSVLSLACFYFAMLRIHSVAVIPIACLKALLNVP